MNRRIPVTTAVLGRASGTARARRGVLQARVLSCCVILAACGDLVRAQDAVAAQREYNVKAASLYAFGRYVTWPESAFAADDSPFVIGVVGANPFGNALELIATKKTINGRAIAIRQLDSPEQAAECHVVFVPRATPAELEQTLVGRTSGHPILLVGESPGFANRGGIINFYLSGGHVRFELNPERGSQSYLSLDAKLLSLGTKAVAQATP
jgi:hypothetical protein